MSGLRLSRLLVPTLCAALALSGGATLGAQASSKTRAPATADAGQTPEAVGKRYIGAIRTGDWKQAAALMHPEALKKFRELMLPIVKADTSGQVARSFFGVTSASQLATLPDAELYVRMMKFLMTSSPELARIMSGSESTVIGHVDEGADVTHVVFRMRATVNGLTVEKMDTMSMRRFGATWRLLLSGDLEGMAAAMRARFRA